MSVAVGAGLGLDGRVVVRTARCRTSRGRGPVQEALERLDPETGLPRSAILVVRRLQGELAGSPPRLRGVELRSVASTAHRAGGSPPPPDCDAVLFTDEAELLVSLCRDVAAGRPLGWWWTTLLGRGAVPGPVAHESAVAAAFDRHVRALPAAAMQAPVAVATAAAMLPPVTVLRTVGAMAEAHESRPLAEAVRRVWQQVIAVASGGSSAPPGAAVVATSEGPAAPASYERSSRPDPRRHDVRLRPPEVVASRADASAAALLVDVAQQLHRDPVGARTIGAAEAFEARCLGATGGHEPARPVTTPDDMSRSEAPTTAPPPVPATHDRDEQATEAPAGRRRMPDAAHDDAPLADTPEETQDSDDQAELDWVGTGLGGAFYLLNLLEELDLPGSAIGSGEPGGLLTRWGVLALALRAWPGVDPDDDLIPMIDALAWPGEDEPSPAVLDADQPWVFRYPPSVVASAWPDLTATPPEPGPEVSLGAPDDQALASPPERWGRQVAELLQALLEERGVGSDVVFVRARVACSGFSVRVHMALDDVDMDVRRAGLDRDPGWVPALGRVVELVFT